MQEAYLRGLRVELRCLHLIGDANRRSALENALALELLLVFVTAERDTVERSVLDVFRDEVVEGRVEVGLRRCSNERSQALLRPGVQRG